VAQDDFFPQEVEAQIFCRRDAVAPEEHLGTLKAYK
jgi:hypothetical protein